MVRYGATFVGACGPANARPSKLPGFVAFGTRPRKLLRKPEDTSGAYVRKQCPGARMRVRSSRQRAAVKVRSPKLRGRQWRSYHRRETRGRERNSEGTSGLVIKHFDGRPIRPDYNSDDVYKMSYNIRSCASKTRQTEGNFLYHFANYHIHVSIYLSILFWYILSSEPFRLRTLTRFRIIQQRIVKQIQIKNIAFSSW